MYNCLIISIRNSYSFIAFNDFDEFFMPSSSHLVSFERLNEKSTELFFTRAKKGSYKIKLDAFKEHLKPSSELSRNSAALAVRIRDVFRKLPSKTHALMLPYSSFIPTSSMDQFCEHLANKTAQQQTRKICYHDMIFNICIDLFNSIETRYASHLCSINENLVRPLLATDDNNPLLNQTSRFGRFFSVSSHFGKSIHETSSIYALATHSAAIQYTSQEKFVATLEPLLGQFCTTQIGYVARFRPIHLEDARTVLNVMNISFDLVFFNAVSLLKNASLH